ncbi:MAG TPA: hypothetical protein VNF49_12325, partial [Candidatus Binataceae bacterium]|nr:hypothetical protein [Candidatus Binataceae bacterium]
MVDRMKPGTLLLALALGAAAVAINAGDAARAQTLPRNGEAPAATMPEAPLTGAPVESDQTLEIAPRVIAPAPAQTEPPASDETAAPANSAGAAASAAAPDNTRPYLGLTAQFAAPRGLF